MKQRVRVIRDYIMPNMIGREGVVTDTWEKGKDYPPGAVVDFGDKIYPYNEDELEFLADEPVKPMDFASLPDGTIIESSDFGDRYYKVSKHKWVVLTDEILSDPETYNTGGMETCGEVFTVIA